MEPGGSENRFDEECLGSDFNSEENNSFELEENLWKRLKDERLKAREGLMFKKTIYQHSDNIDKENSANLYSALL